MADTYIRFYGLNPGESLHLLAEFVREETKHHHLLEDALVLIAHPELLGTGAPPDVSLLIKDQTGGKRSRKWSAALAAFETHYKRLSGSDVLDTTTRVDQAAPLAEALPAILRECNVADERQAARLLDDQKMLVLPGASAEIFDRLRFYATAIRFASATSGSDEYVIYHLIDDAARFSGLQAASDGDMFGGFPLLNAYQSTIHDQQYTLFLPEDFTPDRRSLGYFCSLLAGMPSLFGVDSPLREEEPLAAVYDAEEPDEFGPRLFFTGHLTFHTESRVEPVVEQVKAFEVTRLQDSQEVLDDLQTELRQLSADGHGYKLELRGSRYQEVNEGEYNRLLVIEAEIGERLAELDSFRVARPKLMRFTQTQLPALADVIRSYSVSRLDQLEYGFSGTNDRFSEGVHYLLVPPYVQMNELDPLLYWEAHNEQHMRFWLEPYWTRFYRPPQTKALVFVPQGAMLYPTLHSWDLDTMDDYLREILGERYHGQHGIQALPENPIYLFDGSAWPDTDLYLSVLDRDGFAPLTTKLSWINDNLSLLNDLGLEPFIEQLAEALLRDRLARNFTRRAEESSTEFGRVLLETKDSIAARTEELTDAVTYELTQVVTRSQEFAGLAQQLNERLAQIEALYQEMEELATRTEKLIDETETKAVGELDDYSNKLTVKVERAINKADTTRQKLEEDVAEGISRLLESQTRLHQMLENLRARGPYS